ncbi:MAG: hypothetical protein DRG30_05700 [Epsilonproteobacteria bacterium]|nr:MAG: hypothetical protein DRG30_05700 [Campylobacterota bacterium]
MKYFLFSPLLLLTALDAKPVLENQSCKVCHPQIYQEYQNSMHSKSSIYKDILHKAVWDKHPAKAKGEYSCAKCHTPSDHQLMNGKSQLADNPTQQSEPISCQLCHQIESIEKHAKSNKNIFTSKDKHFFSANKEKKGEKIKFKQESRFFGLLTIQSGSPHHSIDYSNENYYNGDACMGCHSHKQNAKGFIVCDMEVKQGDSKETCISCHMPKVQGSLANHKESPSHAFHGLSIHNSPAQTLAKYVKLTLDQQANAFDIMIKNEATHALFPQPLRLAQLRVNIEREGKTIPLKTESFVKIIGTTGKMSMPWLADSIISDNSIKALETRKIHYDITLQKTDKLIVVFGYYVISPKIAKKLNITDKETIKFIPLTSKRFILLETSEQDK